MFTLFLFPDETKSPASIEKGYFTMSEINLGWNNPIYEFQFQEPRIIYSKIQNHSIKRVVPFSEESVLLAGYLNDCLIGDGISLKTALNCSYRKTQRELLGDLSPYWVRYEEFLEHPFFPYVIKAPFSVLSTGVEVVQNIDFDIENKIKKIRNKIKLDYIKLFRNQEYEIIVEEYLSEPQYEINGIICENEFFFFNVLEQVWNSGRIKEYKSVNSTIAEKSKEIAREAVRRVGLKNCGFNVEIRNNKVIEIQCRLGIENGDYDFLLSPTKYIYDKLVEELS